LDNEGLFCEFVAPRLWEHPKTIDGAYTSNNPSERAYAIERSKRAIDIANGLGCKDIVLWLAREGTYIREAKDPIASVDRILIAVNALLEHDRNIRILGEMKPNEPMDQSYLPTVGHFLALCYRTVDPDRSGVLVESAHSVLAGLDPSDDMACALWHNKLWSVHLNDQNGLKYDQDKTFGSVDLRRAFNTVWVLERASYAGCIGLDVKAMRTTKLADRMRHLANRAGKTGWFLCLTPQSQLPEAIRHDACSISVRLASCGASPGSQANLNKGADPCCNGHYCF
jgi:xylose isomerase